MIAVVLTLMQTVVLSEIVLPPQYTYGFYKWSGWDPEHKPLGRCEGDCDNDDDCQEGMYCYHDVNPSHDPYDDEYEVNDDAIPGCVGTPYDSWWWGPDYCFIVPSSTGHLQFFSWQQTGGMKACQGDCDDDSQCVGSLICYQNHYPPGNAPPGCSGTPVLYNDWVVADYCYDPTNLPGYNPSNPHLMDGLVNLAASDGFASDDSDDEPIEDMEPDQVATDEETASFNDFIPTALGAAAGAAVIVMIVAVVVAMRKKDAAKENVSSSKDVVHVPDESVVTDTAKERETEIEMEVAAE